MEVTIHWRSVPGYEGYYNVSDTGDVKSVERKVVSNNGTERSIKEKLLAQKDNGSGYKFVSLSKNGETKSYYVHRLVAMSFLTTSDEKMVVNHLDGNPANNCVTNLEWSTHAENCKHAYDFNLNSNKGKEHCFAVGIIDNQMGGEYGSIKEWSEARGFKYSTGRNILNGTNSSPLVDRTLIIKLNPWSK